MGEKKYYNANYVTRFTYLSIRKSEVRLHY